MYSTGGDLHLELEGSQQDGDGKTWSIEPFQTKAIMKATFVARRENNHTAYIRIVPKTPHNDYVVIPIEVEVSSEQGLFFPGASLHFGLLTPQDSPVTLPLHLLNSAPKQIFIQVRIVIIDITLKEIGTKIFYYIDFSEYYNINSK